MIEFLWFILHLVIILASLFGIIFCISGMQYLKHHNIAWKEETRAKGITKDDVRMEER